MRVLGTILMGALVCAVQAQADATIASERGLDGFITVERLPIPSQPVLQEGRSVWGDTCQNCHGGNKATGAPKMTSTRAWAPRVEKGLEVLIDHAINGFIGPKYTQMPARGANPDLTDAEVTAAVLFMVWASGGADAAQVFLEKMEGT